MCVCVCSLHFLKEPPLCFQSPLRTPPSNNFPLAFISSSHFAVSESTVGSIKTCSCPWLWIHGPRGRTIDAEPHETGRSMRPVQKVLSAGIAYVATSASGTSLHPPCPRRLRKIPSLGKVCPGQARSQARTVFDMHSSHNLVASFSSEAMSSGLTFDPGHGPDPPHPPPPPPKSQRLGKAAH